MMNFENNAVVTENLQAICLYEIPWALQASIQIDKIIKDLCGYDLMEPVQIKAYPDGIHPDIGYAICKLDYASAAILSSTMEYFNIEIGKDSNEAPIHCRCRIMPVEMTLKE